MLQTNRKFSVPVLDEPFEQEFTQKIYDEQEPDYQNKNGGKPFDSFLVTSGRCADYAGYFRKMEDAEIEVTKRIEMALNKQIEHTSDYLKRLQAAKKRFDMGGIKAFEVK